MLLRSEEYQTGSEADVSVGAGYEFSESKGEPSSEMDWRTLIPALLIGVALACGSPVAQPPVDHPNFQNPYPTPTGDSYQQEFDSLPTATYRPEIKTKQAIPTATPLPTHPSLSEDCDPSYPTICVHPPPPNLDCDDIEHREFKVIPPDKHYFDPDGDGIGCEQ